MSGHSPIPNPTMKTRLFTLLAALLASAAAQDDAKVIVIPPDREPPPPPLMFAASVDARLHATLDEVRGTSGITFRIHQGRPETLSLPLSGEGEVTGVAGEGIRDWAVRRDASGTRFLDVRPDVPENPPFPASISVTLTTTSKVDGDLASPLLVDPGEATARDLSLAITHDQGASVGVVRSPGLTAVAVAPGDGPRFTSNRPASLVISVAPDGPSARGLTLEDAVLAGRLADDATAVSYSLTARATAARPGARASLLSGAAALSGGVARDGWHVVLSGDRYELVAEREGPLDIRLTFDARVSRQGDWHVVNFTMPAGVVVPVRLAGIPDGADFDPGRPVVPTRTGDYWQGLLPADGHAAMAWRGGGETTAGSLFFASTATSDIHVGSGLLRQSTTLGLQVLQGRIDQLTLDLLGPGEVLAVTGPAVTGWSVRDGDAAGARVLDVRLSRPIEGAAEFGIESQTALDPLPVATAALRATPRGALRHSGHLRVAGAAAVRVDVRDASGLIQLSPEQFPGGGGTFTEGGDGAPQRALVYRFPAAAHDFSIHAARVVPETSVSEITIYELGESDRLILADVELDIREAPLREWNILIPPGHAVAAVSGSAVADFTTSATGVGGDDDAADARRLLAITFRETIQGRHLISIRLERNAGPEAGPWTLEPLVHPDARTRRGFVGATAAAGFRITPQSSANLAEVPLTFFPKQTPGLQQAFRIREADWSATLLVEALGQSVQADVFHLHSLKAGAAYGSVVINYFVVGAPATEWRVSVPADAGNLDVTGQNTGRDWRREGDTLVIPLSRPLAGAATLLVTYEQPMSARGGTLAAGVVRPLAVQAERGFIHVVSPEQVKHDVTAEEGPLLAIDASELPPEFRVLSNAPTLAAWQYTGGNINTAIDVEWFAPGVTIDQAVDLARLDTRISRDGEWVTEAGFFVKSAGRPALRLTLPEGTTLWETTVNDSPVNTRDDDGALLVPLPAASGPDESVAVRLRYGARSRDATRPQLAAPVLDAPAVFSEWRVTGDEKRRLIPGDGRAGLVRPVHAESGWQWIARHPQPAALLTGLLVFAGIAGIGKPGVIRIWAARLLGIAAALGSLALAAHAWFTTTPHAATLEFAAPVLAVGESLTLSLQNVAPWRAIAPLPAIIGLGLAAILWLAGNAGIRGAATPQRLHRPLTMIAIIIAGISLLSFHGGAPWFFALIAIACLPRFVCLPRRVAVVPAAATAAFLILLAPALQAAEPAPASPLPPAESLTQQWTLTKQRATATLDIAVRGNAGDRFLLLTPPAVLGGFTPAGDDPFAPTLRVVKATHNGGDAWFVVLENDGRATASAIFEMPLADPAAGWSLPTGRAALQRIDLTWDEPGWEFHTSAAAAIVARHTVASSGASITLAPTADIAIAARPRPRDVASEETRYFAESRHVFLPGPGVVTGHHRHDIRPAQGRVDALDITIPDGLTVSDVRGETTGSWRFDADTRLLRVQIQPAQAQPFSVHIETQRGTDAPPADLTLAPLRIPAAAGDTGTFAIAFGSDTQPENLQPAGLSRVNPEDPGPDLLPRNTRDEPVATIRDAFRYGQAEASLALRVAPVAAELRSEIRQLVSLGEDRLLVTTDIDVLITRAGIFRIEVEIPRDLEVEGVTGPTLAHWTERTLEPDADADPARRLLILHLTGRSIGRQSFALTLAGPSPAAAYAVTWAVPRVSVIDSARETGLLTLVPDRGLQARVENRRNLSQIDPRELAAADHPAARAAIRPGALAWRMLQADWSLDLAINRLAPWITAAILHDATIREGQISERIAITWRIENAAVKSTRIRLPGLDEATAATVRATGPAVADLVRINDADTPDLWELRFQRGIAGETTADIEFQRLTPEDATTATLTPIELPDARQASTFAAIRAGGRLDIDAPEPPRGWQRTDWAVIRTSHGRRAGDTPPRLAFRVAEAEAPLTLTLRRHALADLRRLRVTGGTLTTLLAPNGATLTAVSLDMAATAKTTLRLSLPQGAALFNVFVNEEGAPLVRENRDWLFQVSPAPDATSPASVRFVFSGIPGDATLHGPVLDVPMENLHWRVLVPHGWQLTRHSGDFDLRRTTTLRPTADHDYHSLASQRRKAGAGDAAELLDQAGRWLQSGNQDLAAAALTNVMRNRQLDEASNEDARVQLRELKTQQAVLGLNTRRQRVALDNVAPAAAQPAAAEQLQRAADANPLLQGDTNFDPAQFDRLLEGNTADELTALREIAARIVSQQLAADPAPAAIDPTLPERGTLLEFHRSVQAGDSQPMSITLHLRRTSHGPGLLLALALCLALCLALAAITGRRPA